MKTILRNLLSVLRRFKMATALNILGLSVAFTAFLLIMMQVGYDREFNRDIPNAGRIFRVEPTSPDGTRQTLINRPLMEAFIHSSPHILAGALCDPSSGDEFFFIERNGTRENFLEPWHRVTPDYAKVFSFDMVEGDAQALEKPSTALIPESIAKKLFGDESAVGKRLVHRDRGRALTVGGVYRDFPANSSVGNSIYFPINPKENYQTFDNWNYCCYVLLDDPANAAGLFDNFKAHFDLSSISSYASWDDFSLTLDPLPELHFTTNVSYDYTPKANRAILSVLFAIALIIVLIAGINFTNFSTALAPMRIKSINTQKVLGGDENTIRLSLVMEAVGISLFAFLLALFWVHLAAKSFIAGLLDPRIDLLAHPGLLAITALIAIATGAGAGVYPAFYVTSFPPALVLKGSFGLSPKGRRFRNVLIGVQFVASFALVIGAAFMYLQNYYMRHAPLGYDKDEVIVVNVNQSLYKSLDAFTGKLKRFSGIADVTYAEPLLASKDQYMGWGREYRGQAIDFQCLPVDPSFLRVMGIRVSEGRDFREEDKLTRRGAYIFNERARTLYNMELGSMVDSTEVVGFIPDVKFASFRTEVAPMAFYLWGTRNWGSMPNYAYIKVKAGSDMRAAFEHVQTALKEIDPEFPFNVRFYDEVLNRLYQKEEHISSLILLFGACAILISIVGVFGLVVFDSEYRRKEIGVRKVMGATSGEIILMFNRTYLTILCVCFVIAAPVAGYLVSVWLEGFAYRTPMYWWVYPLAFLLVALVTSLTVTYQNWRAANENPVNSIKNE